MQESQNIKHTNENLRKMTLISMFLAFIGVCIMIYNDSLEGSILGAVIGFLGVKAFNKKNKEIKK